MSAPLGIIGFLALLGGLAIAMAAILMKAPPSLTAGTVVCFADGTTAVVDANGNVSVPQTMQSVSGALNAGFIPSLLPQTLYTIPNSATALTWTVAQCSGAQMVIMNRIGAFGAGVSDITPTAALLIAAVPNWQIGGSYVLRVINANSGGAYTLTVTSGASVTLTGTMTMAQNTWRDFQVTYTGAGTVTLQSMGTGTHS
jgi:hypothetical protein